MVKTNNTAHKIQNIKDKKKKNIYIYAKYRTDTEAHSLHHERHSCQRPLIWDVYLTELQRGSVICLINALKERSSLHINLNVRFLRRAMKVVRPRLQKSALALVLLGFFSRIRRQSL